MDLNKTWKKQLQKRRDYVQNNYYFCNFSAVTFKQLNLPVLLFYQCRHWDATKWLYVASLCNIITKKTWKHYWSIRFSLFNMELIFCPWCCYMTNRTYTFRRLTAEDYILMICYTVLDVPLFHFHMSGTAGECLFHFLFDGKWGRGGRPTILKPVRQKAVEALPAQREAPLPQGLHGGRILTSGRTRD